MGASSRRRRWLWAVFVAGIVGGCTRTTPSQASVPKSQYTAVRTVLPLPDIRGLSGTSADGSGGIWAVLERQHKVLRLAPDSAGKRLVPLGAALPLTGMPAACGDAESLALLADGRLAIGCENDDAGRATDVVLVATIEPAQVRVDEQISVPYDLWGLRGEKNHGIEGLCFAGGYLVAGLEVTGTDNGRRYAPIGVYNFTDHRWTPHRMWLVSDVGKLAGLDCRMDAGGNSIIALAIERHYGVGKLLELRIPMPTRAGDIEPKVIVDLFADEPNGSNVQPNYEGVVRLAADRIVVLSDNHTGSKISETSVLYLNR